MASTVIIINHDPLRIQTCGLLDQLLLRFQLPSSEDGVQPFMLYTLLTAPYGVPACGLTLRLSEARVL